MDAIERVARGMVGESFDKMGHYERQQWLETASLAIDAMPAPNPKGKIVERRTDVTATLLKVENERLRGLVKWCRPRLKRDVYRDRVDAVLGDPSLIV